MNLAAKTIAAIDRFCQEREAKQEPRNHLGASILGDECNRKVFYSYRWASPKFTESRILRLFNRGHREEEVIIALLRGAGMVIYDAGESGELKEQLRITGWWGHFGGTPDGVVTGCPDVPEGEPALLEMKTFNEKQFDKLVAEGVFISNRKYYVQMQIYMKAHDLKYALFFAVCKNDDRQYAQIVPFHAQLAETYWQFAGQVITTNSRDKLPSRISESPGFWKCRFCEHTGVCHQNVTPQANCRTCAFGHPETKLQGGAWHCLHGMDEIREQPHKGCHRYQVDTNIFQDDTPF